MKLLSQSLDYVQFRSAVHSVLLIVEYQKVFQAASRGEWEEGKERKKGFKKERNDWTLQSTP